MCIVLFNDYNNNIEQAVLSKLSSYYFIIAVVANTFSLLYKLSFFSFLLCNIDIYIINHIFPFIATRLDVYLSITACQKKIAKSTFTIPFFLCNIYTLISIELYSFPVLHRLMFILAKRRKKRLVIDTKSYFLL